jgi:AraC-like DNA-binding protein
VRSTTGHGSRYDEAVTVDADLFRRLCRARDRLHEESAHPPELREIARFAGVSPFHLLRVFRACFGETPHAYVSRLRIERSKELLRKGHTVTDACLEAGFSSFGSFSALFKKQVGVAPSQYARSLRAFSQCPDAIASTLVPFCFVEAFAPSFSRIAILEKPLAFRP